MVHFKDPFEKIEEQETRRQNLRKPLVAGNWKMHMILTEAMEYGLDIKKRVADVTDVEILVCPPYPFLGQLAKIFEGSMIKVGAQNLHWEPKGAFTGEVSALMLESVRCSHVIIGHSERRHIFKETSEEVNKKVFSTLGSFLTPVVCVGETLEEREASKTEEVLREQVTQSLAGLNAGQMLKCVIAYEPVWAIGTGKTATPHQANDAQDFTRGLLKELFGSDVAEHTRILYGGSVKPDNVAELMKQPDIDGVLVGGASLTVDSFEKLIRFKDQEPKQEQ